MSVPRSPREVLTRPLVGVVSAYRWELTAVSRYWHDRSQHAGGRFSFVLGRTPCADYVGVVCGPGMPAARDATLAMLDAYRPQLLLAVGIAGAIDPQLGPLGAVRAIASAATGAQNYESDVTPIASMEVAHVVTSAVPLLTRAAKQRVWTQQWATLPAMPRQLVDMETAAVAEVATQNGVPWSGLRAVSDLANEELPTEVDGLLTRRGPAQWGYACGALFARPGLSWELWRLKANTDVAIAALAERWPSFAQEVEAWLVTRAGASQSVAT